MEMAKQKNFRVVNVVIPNTNDTQDSMKMFVVIPGLKTTECEVVERGLCSGKKLPSGRVVGKDVRQDSMQMSIILPNVETKHSRSFQEECSVKESTYEGGKEGKIDTNPNHVIDGRQDSIQLPIQMCIKIPDLNPKLAECDLECEAVKRRDLNFKEEECSGKESPCEAGKEGEHVKNPSRVMDGRQRLQCQGILQSESNPSPIRVQYPKVIRFFVTLPRP